MKTDAFSQVMDASCSPDKKGGDIVIVRKDYASFLDGLDKGSVDLILTDPPYTISRKTGFANLGKNSVKRFAVSMDFGKWDKVQIDLDKMSSKMYKALRTGGTAIVWYDYWKFNYLADAMVKSGFKMLRSLIWQKTNPVPLNKKANYLSNSREVAVLGVKGGKATFNSDYDNGVYDMPIPRHNGRRIHPTQKPLDLFCELINKHSNEGDLVVDCFLGGGTTAVAAKKTRRRFKGCDKDFKYVKLSRERPELNDH